MNHVVIMAGGIGSRFWPLSTPECPKQFIDILGCGRSLLQLTVDRFKGICEESNLWVVTNEKYVTLIREQVPTIPVSHILAEPVARNTAPCVAWAGWRIMQEDEEANIAVTPADAIIMNVDGFRTIINEALAYTNNTNAIVTLGIVPNRPETGYGYVETDSVMSGNVHKVVAFREKPNLETAQQYIKAGNYLWNAGIFVWNINTLVNSIRRHAPQIASVMDQMVLETLKPSETPETRTKQLFPTCDKISIDYAVMEKHTNVCTIPADVQWSDLGNWQSLQEKLQKDSNNNASVGNIRFIESSNNVVHMENAKRVVLQGLNGYIVSEKNGQFLVCKRSEEQRIKDFSCT